MGALLKTEASKNETLHAAGNKIFPPETDSTMYCIPSADCTFGDGISDFIFANLQHLASGCSPNGYGDFTGMQAAVEIGKNYIASFKSGYDDQKVSMWVDMNNDTVFSAAECVLANLKLTSAGKWYSGAVTIPVNATPGIYRLRVGANWQGHSASDPCGSFSYGEWEDYHIQITGEPAQTNVAADSIHMTPIMPAGELVPWASVKNLGMDTATVYVTMQERSLNYSSTKYIWKVAPGAFYQLSFDTLSIEPGIYNFSIKSETVGDEIPEDDSLAMEVLFTDQPRQKVIAEFFTGTWNPNCPIAAKGLDLLQQHYADTLAVIAWHIGDAFEIPVGTTRDAWYRINGYPTVWFDGWENVIGAYPPDNYPYFNFKMEKRVPYPSNYEVSVVLSEPGDNTLRAHSTVKILQGNTSENLAAFVVLTESNLPSPGNENQNFVARKVYPDAMGRPLDFSMQSVHSWDTDITIEQNYNRDKCEIVVFVQNMDTQEIYQATSRMAEDITSVISTNTIPEINIFPNPASETLEIKAASEIEQVLVFNDFGERVMEMENTTNFLRLNLQGFDSGIYFIRVQTANNSSSEKVIIQ